MKTIKRIPIEPVFVETVPPILEPNKIYVSEKYGCAIHLCLCGCGSKTVMPFGNRKFGNNNWDLVKELDGTISFIGSVGNFQFDCKSHYMIQHNVGKFMEK